MSKNPIIECELKYSANNYDPLPVVLVKGEGVYLWDDAGKRYIDMMSAYSAVSHGHCHPKLVKTLQEQAERLTIVSRSFFTDKLSGFLKKLSEISGFEKILPMNTGAEAVETALKAARKWAYRVKGVAKDKAEIIACAGNFHGRTITIVGMSTEPQYKDGFGPFSPGFKIIPFGDIDALKRAITPETAAFLVEPIQGEGGIIVPPQGYLKEAAKVCRENNVLFICDEIQTGLGRTGKLFAYQHEDCEPDGLILGKALGGGLMPVSAFLCHRAVMDVMTPGDHGSTFGGNPLAATVGLKAIEVLQEENLIQNAKEIGDYFISQLRQIKSPLIVDIRGRGLLIGLEIAKHFPAREISFRLLEHGILTKETHQTVIRFAPPLLITKAQIDTAVKALESVFYEIESELSTEKISAEK